MPFHRYAHQFERAMVIAALAVALILFWMSGALAEPLKARRLAAGGGGWQGGGHVIATANDMTMHSIQQGGPFGHWGRWTSLGNPGTTMSVLPSPGGGPYDYFVIGGQDGAIYHSKSRGSVPGVVFQRLGLPGAKALSAARIRDGGWEVFAIGSDNAVWAIWQDQPDGPWSNWESLGGWASRIAAITNANGGHEVYVLGSDGAVWVRWQDQARGNWSDWAGLGGWGRELSAVVTPRQGGGVEVFVIGSDNAVWIKWQDQSLGNWSDWVSLGGNVSGNLSVKAFPPAGMGVFALGADGIVRARQQSAPYGDWRDWTVIAGTPVQSFDAIPLGGQGGAEVFAVAQDGTVVHAFRGSSSAGWSGWVALDYEQPPPPPPPPPPTYVPSIVGLLSSEASKLLERADLKTGLYVNLSNEFRSDRLKVVAQDPEPGKQVERGSRVNYRVDVTNASKAGVKGYRFYNCSQRKQPVTIWRWQAGAQWIQTGNLPFRADIPCGQANAPSITVQFEDGVGYTVTAVDTSLLNCGENNPVKVSCQYYTVPGLGNSEGPVIPMYIP